MHVGLALVVLEDRLQLVEQARGPASRRRSSARSGPAGRVGGRARRAGDLLAGRVRSARASWTTSLVSPRSLWSSRPRTRTTASGCDHRRALGLVGLEDQHLDLALDVVEGREHHLVAALGADLLAVGDDPADRDPGAVGLARRAAAMAAVDPGPQRRRRLRPAGARRGRCRASPSPSPAARRGRTRRPGSAAGAGGRPGRRRSPARVLAAEVEDRALAELRVLLRLLARRLGRGQRLQHPLAAWRRSSRGRRT